MSTGALTTDISIQDIFNTLWCFQNQLSCCRTNILVSYTQNINTSHTHAHTHTFAHTVSNSKAPIRKQIMNLLRKDWVGGVQHKGEVNSSVLKLTRVNKRMSLDLLLIDCYTFPMISCVFVVFTYKKISNIKREKSVFFKEISRCGH